MRHEHYQLIVAQALGGAASWTELVRERNYSSLACVNHPYASSIHISSFLAAKSQILRGGSSGLPVGKSHVLASDAL